MTRINKQSYYNITLYFYIVYTFLSNISYIEESFPLFKYLKYFSFIIFIIYISNFRLNKRINPQLIPFLVLIGSALLRFNQISIQTIYNIIFYISGLILFIDDSTIKFPVKKALYLSMTMGAIFFLSSPNIFYSITLQSLINPPEVPASLSYIFGFLTVILTLEKRYKLALISFIFIVILPKRLVLVSTLLIILIQFMPFFIRKVILWKSSLALINITYIILTLFLAIGAFDYLIIEYTGLQPGHFTSGRTTLFNYIVEKSDILENFRWLLGIGEGETVNLLKGNFGGIYLLHNDIFKIFIEHGIIVLIIFSVLLYRKGNHKQKMISLFYNFLLFADNTLIYSFAFIFYFMAWKHFADDNQQYSLKHHTT